MTKSIHTDSTSGLGPTPGMILVRPDIPLAQTAGGIWKPDETLRREEAAAMSGVVVVAGEGAAEFFAPGRRVAYPRYSGTEFPGKDGVIYKIMREEDVICFVDGEND